MIVSALLLVIVDEKVAIPLGDSSNLIRDCHGLRPSHRTGTSKDEPGSISEPRVGSRRTRQISPRRTSTNDSCGETSQGLALVENRYDRAVLRMRIGDTQGALDELEQVFEWRPFHLHLYGSRSRF